MRKKKENRIVRRYSVSHQYLSDNWKGDPGMRHIDAIYQSVFGLVRVFGFDTPDDAYVRYAMIVYGIEYEMRDPIVRSEHGICCIASRFARDVVNRRYDNE